MAIVHSAGHALLDNSVLNTLRQWRVKPHTIDKVYVPVTFSLSGARERQVLKATGGNVLYSPYPHFPLSVRWEYPGGKGAFRLLIDRQSGWVTSVNVLQTMGDNRLDAAALVALRQWRFKPHTLSQLVVPLEF